MADNLLTDNNVYLYDEPEIFWDNYRFLWNGGFIDDYPIIDNEPRIIYGSSKKKKTRTPWPRENKVSGSNIWLGEFTVNDDNEDNTYILSAQPIQTIVSSSFQFYKVDSLKISATTKKN